MNSACQPCAYLPSETALILHFQCHLSGGLELVSANRREISLGDERVRRSQAISPPCSVQELPYLSASVIPALGDRPSFPMPGLQ